MNNTKTIEKIIKSKEAPKNTNVIWLDLNETEDINNPSLKVFNDGKWVYITADMQELINTLDIVLQDKADLVGGKVPASQLPSYVDDVIEFYDISHSMSSAFNPENVGKIYFMQTGDSREKLFYKFATYAQLYDTDYCTYKFAFEPERGKLYLSTNTNKLYRWTGSVLVDITQKGLQLGTTSTEAFPANLGYKHETGRFGSNDNIEISNGSGSIVRIGPMTGESVYIAGNVSIGQQMTSVMSYPVKIGGNVNVYACTIGTKNTPEGMINIGTNCTNNNNILEIKGNTTIGSRVYIKDNVNISSNTVIGSKVNIKFNVYISSNTVIGSKVNIADLVHISSNTTIGTYNASINIANYANRNHYINMQGHVEMGTMGTGMIEILGSTKIGNTSNPLYIANIYSGIYDQKATTISSGAYIGNNAFIGSNIKIGQFDSDSDYYGSSNIQIGTTNNSNINIQGINVLIGKNKDSEVVIGLDSTDNSSSPTNGVHIGNRVVILDDFDSRNIVLGTNSKSKIKINNVDGELSFGTNGDNYAITFGTNSITFTNKNTNLSTSLTLS